MIQVEETQQHKPKEEVLDTVFTQMKVTGNRPRTIELRYIGITGESIEDLVLLK